MTDDLTLREAIALAVTTEQLGCQYYERMAKKFSDDKEASEAFAQLALDEKAHEAQFKRILEEVPEEEGTAGRYELYQYLRATAISQFFQQDYFKKADKVKTTSEALAAALHFEKSTMQFYQAIREITGENKQLDAVIAAERRHVLAIVRILPTDAKFRGLGDTF